MRFLILREGEVGFYTDKLGNKHNNCLIDKIIVKKGEKTKMLHL